MEVFVFGWCMNKSTVSCTKRSTHPQILYYVLERWTRTKSQTLHGKTDWSGSKIHHTTELWTELDGQPIEFGWNIFPEFTTLELVREVQKFMSKMGEPEQFQRRIIFMSMFNDIIWWKKDIETDCIANSTLVSLFAKRFPGNTLVIPRT